MTANTRPGLSFRLFQQTEWTGLVVAGAVEDVDGMGEQLSKGVEGFDCAFGAAGKVKDE